MENTRILISRESTEGSKVVEQLQHVTMAERKRILDWFIFKIEIERRKLESLYPSLLTTTFAFLLVVAAEININAERAHATITIILNKRTSLYCSK